MEAKTIIKYIAEIRHNTTNELKNTTFITLTDEVSDDEAAALIEEVLVYGYHAEIIKKEVVKQ